MARGNRKKKGDETRTFPFPFALAYYYIYYNIVLIFIFFTLHPPQHARAENSNGLAIRPLDVKDY